MLAITEHSGVFSSVVSECLQVPAGGMGGGRLVRNVFLERRVLIECSLSSPLIPSVGEEVEKS